jgi:hypothetical protein
VITEVPFIMVALVGGVFFMANVLLVAYRLDRTGVIGWADLFLRDIVTGAAFKIIVAQANRHDLGRLLHDCFRVRLRLHADGSEATAVEEKMRVLTRLLRRSLMTEHMAR